MRRNIAAQIDRLKQVIGKIIPAGTKYALLDFSDYSNVGDSAIRLGEIKLSSQLTGNILHAHILSTLFNIPHVALDNNYGKVSGYINAWNKSHPSIRVAKTSKETLKKLR